MSLLFRGRETRSVSYQDVWGSGEAWQREGAYSPENAVKLAAVRGCVRLKAGLLMQLPFDSYRSRNGGSEPVSPTPGLVAKPSGVVNRATWLEQLSVSLDYWGNAYGVIVGRDGRGFPTQVEWLPPSIVVAEQSAASTRPRFTVGGVPFPAEDMLHVAENVAPGTAIGMAPLDRDGLVDLAVRAQEFGRRWFADGAHPSAIIQSSAELTREQAQGIKDAWYATLGNKRSVMVMGKGLEHKTVSVPANESQFLETTRATQVDVCMSFGVPPEMLGIATSGQSVTYANREGRILDVLTTTLNPRLVVIQEALSAVLPGPQFVRFNTGALLRSDLTTRYASYVNAARVGLLTVNEMRELEDRPPFDGGDVPPAPPTGSAPTATA